MCLRQKTNITGILYILRQNNVMDMFYHI